MKNLNLIPSAANIIINRKYSIYEFIHFSFSDQIGYERPKNNVYNRSPYTLLPTEGQKNGYEQPNCIPIDQAETRMMYVLKKFSFIDTQTIDFKKPFDQLSMDSLDVISVITSIQYEFNTVFEDNVFDRFNSFQDVADYVSRVSGMI